MDGKKEADCSVQEKEDNYGRGRRNRRKLIKREFPPPIPLLARTENLLCHMPWVLKRYYKSDGRLILQEERVKHHEYFRAHRANGRLTLQLVNLDVKEEKPEVYLDDEADGGPDQEDDDHEVMDGNDEKKHPLDDHEVDEEVLEESTMILASSMPEPLMGNGNGAGKCSRLNSDLFRMPIPTIRPVYT
ncbi:hypothetical protein HHK36_004073 [Tetracentron sinense]|uniref:FAF domain-containing protein n=1 Tax=Tetracentron sinense TaxID=13715 RepID=A0A834ZQI2_TETSI|nr:hypothetical protein HHK36_004073 [Tetracentron sinense]